MKVRDLRVGILPLNTALFCRADDDHANLWVGRRPLGLALEELEELEAHLRIALIHHPTEWLADIEKPNIEAALAGAVDIILRGHLHDTAVSSVVVPQGAVIHLAAGALYQSRKYPLRALYCTADGESVSVFPIRYEDSPTEVWVVDPSVYPHTPGHEGVVKLSVTKVNQASSNPTPPPIRASDARFPSNVPSRYGVPVIGRDREIGDMAAQLSDRSSELVLVVVGPSGVGKSELTREFARRNRGSYPGGTFIVDASGTDAPIELASVGSNFLGLEFRDGLSIEDQCIRALAALGTSPTLIIYDNVRSFEHVQSWLPVAGMPLHCLISTVNVPATPGWHILPVEPLPEQPCLELIERLAGSEVASVHGRQLVEHSGGLPVELCSVAVMLGNAHRLGRDAAPYLNALAEETQASFSLPYGNLDPAGRLLLHAAAARNPHRINRDQLQEDLFEALQWSTRDFNHALDACLDLQLLEGQGTLTMHQLLATFLRSADVDDKASLDAVRATQRVRLMVSAVSVVEDPADTEKAQALTGFALGDEAWLAEALGAGHADRGMIGIALGSIGQFEKARPWFEGAIVQARSAGASGDVDHNAISGYLHQAAYCLTALGEFAGALPIFEEAVAEARKGDAPGMTDHDRLGRGLHQVGFCLSSLGRVERARKLYEEAVEEKRKGDLDGKVDHESIGNSLYQIGMCWMRDGEPEKARGPFEESVAESRRGDVNGRINHESLSSSLHQVGAYWVVRGDYAQARPWFEEAVEESRRGDVHGRVDHASLGRSLHQVGSSWIADDDFTKARPYLEDAVGETRRGDVHGRVDHDILGSSLRLVGMCWIADGDFDKALPWAEEAVEEIRQGDIHGRINSGRLGKALHTLGECWFGIGNREQQARPLFEEAVGRSQDGDLHGRVDHDSVGKSLYYIGLCWARAGDLTKAHTAIEQAVAEARRGDEFGRVEEKDLTTMLRFLEWVEKRMDHGPNRNEPEDSATTGAP